MGDYDGEFLTEARKVEIVESFITNAPPGEFNEVFNDVRVLVDDDKLLKTACSHTFSAYNTEQFVPCRLTGAQHDVLVTKHGQLGEGEFYDPSSKQKFHYDHLRKEASNVEAYLAENVGESWRVEVEEVLRGYISSHYPHGNMSVYSKSGDEPQLVICIEDHQLQPQNFWNGRWRSEWVLPFNPNETVTLKGTLKLQVHYYEDGNVQLVSSKDIAKDVHMDDPKRLSGQLLKIIKEEETIYQQAINENYEKMSSTAFKSLRRQLPITRTKIDWNKIVSYKVGKDLKS